MKRNTKIKKFDMCPSYNHVNDINLFITSENELYQKPHTHSFFEFMFVVKGKLRQNVNGVERVLSENDICVLRPEACHTLQKHENTPFILYNFEDYINELCQPLGLHSVDEIFSETDSYAHCNAAEAMEYIKIITSPSIPVPLVRFKIKQTFLKIIISKILMGFILNPSHDLIHNKENSLIDTMLALLEDKANFNKSIKELCDQTFYTQEHITRLFRKANLNSPNRIHLQKKLQYDANLLLNSDMKIIEIAEQCGIETVSYFTKTFKREYGISPSTYKKMYRANQ